MAYQSNLLEDIYRRQSQRRALTGLPSSYQETRALYDSALDYDAKKARDAGLLGLQGRGLRLQEQRDKDAAKAATVSGVGQVAMLPMAYKSAGGLLGKTAPASTTTPTTVAPAAAGGTAATAPATAQGAVAPAAATGLTAQGSAAYTGATGTAAYGAAEGSGAAGVLGAEGAAGAGLLSYAGPVGAGMVGASLLGPTLDKILPGGGKTGKAVGGAAGGAIAGAAMGSVVPGVGTVIGGVIGGIVGGISSLF